MKESPEIEYLQFAFFCKRAMDIVLSVMILFFILPIFALVAFGIRLDSPGPVFFMQKRMGRNRKEFMLIKFRTMRIGIPDPRPRYETQKDDPRITPFGRIVRENGVDELAQIFNVIKGEMSIAGPRPLVEWESNECVGDYACRFLFKPGITGLSVIQGRNNPGWDERVKKDVEYVHNWSMFLDVKIILKTPFVILFSKEGIYPQEEIAKVK